jgi:thymidylate synthase (FAD)
MTLEIETTRGIAAQILRHRSFTFQEFSQRYADTNLITERIPVPDLRRQDTKNRQNSTDDLGDYVKLKFQTEIAELFTHSNNLYKRMLEAGVAKECARFVLPLATPTRIYMTGSCRSWITYIALREKSGTQKEHMDIAKACKSVFAEQFPICYESLGGEAEWVL